MAEKSMSGGDILLVDDDARITRMIRRVAERVGFSVTEINDPLLFEVAYRSVQASLIILDLNMPGKDGIELLDYLAEQQCSSSIMVISGVDRRVLGTTEQLAKSRGLDVVAMLQKPVDVVKLREILEDHAKSHGVPTVDDLDIALESGQLTVAYQPKIDLGTDRVVGAEALARWNHPAMGFISPEVFVAMAENTGRIETLTAIIFEQALRDALEWSEIIPDLHLAVNLSPQLLSDLTLPDRLEEGMKLVNFPAERLTLEITERGAMDDINRSMAILSRLRLKGAALSIDDFGTGSSSLVQLYRMPFGEIKIDKSFVIDMLENHEAEVIVNSIILLGKSMGLSVIAEGVENQAVLDSLKAMGCDQIQGYFISRPVPQADFMNLLREQAQGFG